MEDNLNQPQSPDYDKIINEYLADGSSEGEGDEEEAQKDLKRKKKAANEKQEKDETNTAGTSNWKKRKIRKREREQAKKARAESSSSSSDDFVNTTLADQFNEKCDSSSGKNLFLLISQQFLIIPNF